MLAIIYYSPVYYIHTMAGGAAGVINAAHCDILQHSCDHSYGCRFVYTEKHIETQQVA